MSDQRLARTAPGGPARGTSAPVVRLRGVPGGGVLRLDVAAGDRARA